MIRVRWVEVDDDERLEQKLKLADERGLDLISVQFIDQDVKMARIIRTYLITWRERWVRVEMGDIDRLLEER